MKDKNPKDFDKKKFLEENMGLIFKREIGKLEGVIGDLLMNYGFKYEEHPSSNSCPCFSREGEYRNPIFVSLCGSYILLHYNLCGLKRKERKVVTQEAKEFAKYIVRYHGLGVLLKAGDSLRKKYYPTMISDGHLIKKYF